MKKNAPIFGRKKYSHKRWKARQIRQEKMEKHYLLYLQTLPPEKFVKIFRKVLDHEVLLLGLKKYPYQRNKFFGLDCDDED